MKMEQMVFNIRCSLRRNKDGVALILQFGIIGNNKMKKTTCNNIDLDLTWLTVSDTCPIHNLLLKSIFDVSNMCHVVSISSACLT